MVLTKESLLNLKRIAIIRTDKLGDMVLTLPMVRILKQINPNFRVFIIASKYTEPLLIHQELIDRYYFINEEKINRIIKTNDIEAVFFPRADFGEAIQALTGGAKHRIGTAYRFFSFLYNQKIYEHRKISKFHEAEYNTRMISSITNEQYKTELLRPYVEQLHIQKLSQFFDIPFVILHPGSGGSARDLPIGKWKLIAKETLRKDFNIIITGTENEKYLCDEISRMDKKIINLSGKLNLSELIALISKTELLFANSTGIIHIAASLNIKTVGFYPNSPFIGAERWKPYSDNCLIIKPTSGDDMNLIADNDMLLSISNFLNSL